MKIRKATKKDILEINEIYTDGAIDEVKIQFPKKSKKSILKEMERAEKERLSGFSKGLKSKGQYWIVAEEKGNITGFGQATITNKRRKLGEMEKIYVNKKYRGKGIGIKISKELLKWLKKQKIIEVIDKIYFKNKPSLKMHEKIGFEIIGVGMHKKLK